MVTRQVLSDQAISRRRFWISEIVKISGDFGQDASRVEQELAAEVSATGEGAILDHLRLCGAIPESYRHDSSEEKLYSKYTDALLAVTFRALGLSAAVLAGRADAADVEAIGPTYSFVADAKAFRLSRTAKNQKDFKVEAMHGWKRGKPYAVVACPLYQLPRRTSQIYQQAIARNICLLSFAHLAVLVAFAQRAGTSAAQELFGAVLGCIGSMNPGKDAVAYWMAMNRTFLDADESIAELWQTEKIANLEAITVAKDEALSFLAQERESILRLSREEALRQLIRANRIDDRIEVISSVTDNQLLSVV